MAWSTESSETKNSVTTEQFSSNITLNPGETAHCEVDVDFPTTPTDNCVVSVYGSVDGGTDYDDVPVFSFEVDNGVDPCQASFLVYGLYSFRIGVKRSGTTDTITSVVIRWKKDGINL